MEPAKHDTRYQTMLWEKEAEEEARRSEKEIERDVRMEEKEITSVEDVEELLTPMEIDKPTQKEDLSTQEMFRIMMEQRREDKEELNKKFELINDNFKKMDKKQNEKLDKKFESLNETLTQKMKEENKIISEKIERSNEKTSEALRLMKEDIETLNDKIEYNQDTLPVSYTHLDVYKRQNGK